MEFIPLRNLQRGLPEVWQTLRQENGRVVLTNKGQPAYLLVDLAGQNVVSLINWLDYYRANAKFTLEPPSLLSPEQKAAAKRFLMTAKSIREEGLTADDETALAKLESGAYRPSFSRGIDL